MRTFATGLTGLIGALLFYGALLLLLVSLMVMLLGGTGGLPTGNGYIGAISVRAPLVLALAAGLGFLIRRSVRPRIRHRS